MSTKTQKIVFIIPNLGLGGMERVMSELLHYFSKHTQHELHLVLYGIHRRIFYPIPNNIVVYRPQFEFNNKIRLWSTLKTLVYIRRTINNIQPDSILSFGEYWNNFVLLSLLGLKYPVYVSDRSQPNKSLGKFHDTLRNWLYPKAKGVICQTEKARQIYKQMFKHDNFTIIGNPIKKINEAENLAKEDIVLSVGRLIDTKHFDEMIQIFADINNPAWKLIIVGDNALQQDNKTPLQQMIDNLNMQDRIILAGRQSDVDRYYNKSKIFAFTSSSEGFPNVVGEAMSAGLPVVAYDCIAGPSDLIDDEKTGYLISLHDTQTFKTKLIQLMENEDLIDEMGANAKQKINNNSLDVIGLKFKEAILNENQ